MLKSKINLRTVHVAPCRSTTSLECSDPLEILDAAMRCPQRSTQRDPTVSKPRPFCYGLKANRVHPCENLKAALDGERNSATPNHDLARSDGPDSGGYLSSFKPPTGMPRSQRTNSNALKLHGPGTFRGAGRRRWPLMPRLSSRQVWTVESEVFGTSLLYL